LEIPPVGLRILSGLRGGKRPGKESTQTFFTHQSTPVVDKKSQKNSKTPAIQRERAASRKSLGYRGNERAASHPATNHAAFAEVHDPPETKQSPQSSMTRMTRSRRSPPTKNVFMFLNYFKRFVNIFFQKN